ncbi:hypothetical protein PTKIN_Ptkin10aG0048700 [Pterospermum kingtungense]
MGGSAVLLSNRSSDRPRSKYQLVHTLRTHKGADDKSYKCVFEQNDETNQVGRVFKMKIKPCIPDFKLAFEHFCIHGVLDELEKSLDLTRWHMEPSRMTLYRFGNTSSGSLWYELSYLEAKGRIKKHDRIWQIGLGSGFKCNSAVWRALRTINPSAEKNPWTDEIIKFPVQIS